MRYLRYANIIILLLAQLLEHFSRRENVYNDCFERCYLIIFLKTRSSYHWWFTTLILYEMVEKHNWYVEIIENFQNHWQVEDMAFSHKEWKIEKNAQIKDRFQNNTPWQLWSKLFVTLRKNEGVSTLKGLNGFTLEWLFLFIYLCIHYIFSHIWNKVWRQQIYRKTCTLCFILQKLAKRVWICFSEWSYSAKTKGDNYRLDA